MTDVIEIVPASQLQGMLEGALLEAGLYHDCVLVGKEDAFWDERPGKSLAQGTAEVLWDADRNETQHFEWEINGGTHKDDILVFDELEVVIDFEEDDDE
jgi:hypothetical protein